MRARTTIVALGMIAGLLGAAPAAQATAPTCTYNATTDSVTLDMFRTASARLFVGSGDEIKVRSEPKDADCGDATTGNTDSIEIIGGDNDLDQLLVIAQNGVGGLFPTGISFLFNAGPGSDELRLVGTTASDSFRFGMLTQLANPLADLNGGGSWNIATNDVESASARMLAGNDRVTGNPQGPNELPSPFPLDLKGNRGADSLIGAFVIDLLAGGSGDDDEKGLGGADILLGQAGDDDLNGGPGIDDCSGGRGDDRLRGCEG